MTPVSALVIGPVSRVISLPGKTNAARNRICLGSTTWLTIRRVASLVTLPGMGPEVSMITCLLRRVYSGLIKGAAVFCFFYLVTVVNFFSSVRGALAAAVA